MPSTPTIARQVYVFDSAVPEFQKLIDAVGVDQKIIILDAKSDGVLQLANALAGESGIAAIHIFSHGSAGSLSLGSSVLNQVSLPNYSAALAQIGQALTDSGDLLLYGCNVAQGDVGQEFITQLAAATGADVAASTDLTGAAELGGDWVLESQSGQVDGRTSIDAIADFASLLSVTEVTNSTGINWQVTTTIVILGTPTILPTYGYYGGPDYSNGFLAKPPDVPPENVSKKGGSLMATSNSPACGQSNSPRQDG